MVLRYPLRFSLVLLVLALVLIVIIISLCVCACVCVCVCACVRVCLCVCECGNPPASVVVELEVGELSSSAPTGKLTWRLGGSNAAGHAWFVGLLRTLLFLEVAF